jgi:hypothetical protein
MNNLINVFLEPRETFTSLQEQNNWKNAFLPIVIAAVVGFSSMAILGELLTEVQIEQTEKYIMGSSQIPDDQKEEILSESLEKITDPTSTMVFIGYVSSSLSTPVRIFMMSLIILLIGNFFFGGKSSYGTILVMTSYTYMIAVIESLIKIPLMVSQWRVDIHTGLGLLGLGEKGSFLYNFMGGMDLFAFWRVIVLAVGMSVLYRREVKPFMIALVIYWILQTTFFSFIGSLFT